eukprot:m51a1_g2433 hypothetical protein (619) ;mRNA; f:845513-847826
MVRRSCTLACVLAALSLARLSWGRPSAAIMSPLPGPTPHVIVARLLGSHPITISVVPSPLRPNHQDVFCAIHYSDVASPYSGSTWLHAAQRNGTYAGARDGWLVYVVNVSDLVPPPGAASQYWAFSAYCADGPVDPPDFKSPNLLWATADGSNLYYRVLRSADCGDGMVEYWDGEQCEGSVGCADCRCSSAELAPSYSFVNQTICSLCGNGRIDAGEQCDPPDANKTCVWKCMCGDAYPFNSASGACEAVCGDHKVGAPEQCDSDDPLCVNCRCTGATWAEDGQCKHYCGNGKRDEAVGEQCDSSAGDVGCLSNCTCPNGGVLRKDSSPARCSLCGNKRLDEGEQCDNPGSPFCSDSCLCPDRYVTNGSISCSLCGNGIIDRSFGEECELISDHCLHNCRCASGWSESTDGYCSAAKNEAAVIGGLVGGIIGGFVLVLVATAVVVVIIKNHKAKRQAPTDLPLELASDSWSPVARDSQLASTAGMARMVHDGPSGPFAPPTLANAFPPPPAIPAVLSPPPIHATSTVLYDATGNPVPVMLIGALPPGPLAGPPGCAPFSPGMGVNPFMRPAAAAPGSGTSTDFAGSDTPSPMMHEAPPAIPQVSSGNIFSLGHTSKSQ